MLSDFPFLLEEGLKTTVIVGMSVFDFFIVVLNFGDGCFL